MIQKINYKSLLTQAKKTSKRDTAFEKTEIEKQVTAADYRLYEFHEYNLNYVKRIVELTKNGNEILIERCERRPVGNSLMFLPTASEKAEMEDEIRAIWQTKFNESYEKQLNEIVDTLAEELIAENKRKAAEQEARDNAEIRQAILKVLAVDNG